MKNKLAGLLCLCLVLCLCGCGRTAAALEPAGGTAAETAPVPAQDGGILTPEEAPAEEPEDSAWKEAYADILKEAETLSASAAEEPAPESEYALCDMDRDGTPELLVKTGTCEADYMASIYAFRGGEAVLLGEIGAGHTSFYGDRDGEGFLILWGHMGYAEADRCREENGALVTELLYEDNLNERLEKDPDADYLPVTDLVPGAFPLTLVEAGNPLPLTHYEEIRDCLEGRAPAAEKLSAPRGDPDFFRKLIAGDAEVSAYGVNRFANSPGPVGFQTLLKKDTAAPWMGGDLTVTDVLETDLNGDGQLECILSLCEENGGSRMRFFLSEEDGTVYAYLQNYVYNELTEAGDGSFLLSSEYDLQHCRLVFEKEHSFLLQLPA